MNWFFIIILLVLVGFLFRKKLTVLVKKPAAPAPAQTPTPKPAPAPAPAPVPPTAESNELQVTYPNLLALLSFIDRTKSDILITVDGEIINAGFAPAAKFVTQLDGSLKR